MTNYKPTTQQILNVTKDILDHLKSDSFKSATSAQDISSQGSAYRSGEQTLADAIKTLELLCRALQRDAEVLDGIDNVQRQNILNHLNNINSWIATNPVGNWNSIISYVNQIVSWTISSGINPYAARVDRSFEKKIASINIKNEEIESLQELHKKLAVIQDADQSLTQARDILSFIAQTNKVKEVADYVANAQTKIDELNLKAESLLDNTSNAVIFHHFTDVADLYRKRTSGFKNGTATRRRDFYKKYIPGWSFWIMVSIVIFAANIFIVIKWGPELVYLNEYLRLLANGSVRLVLLSPSLMLLAFVTRNFSRSDKMRESYEFKGVTAKTLEGHLIALQNRGIDSQVLGEIAKQILVEIYREPTHTDNTDAAKQSGMFLESLSENVSFIERIKQLLK